MALTVRLDPKATASLVTKDVQSQPVATTPYQAIVPAGDVVIFAWVAAGDEAVSAGRSL